MKSLDDTTPVPPLKKISRQVSLNESSLSAYRTSRSLTASATDLAAQRRGEIMAGRRTENVVQRRQSVGVTSDLEKNRSRPGRRLSAVEKRG